MAARRARNKNGQFKKKTTTRKRRTPARATKRNPPKRRRRAATAKRTPAKRRTTRSNPPARRRRRTRRNPPGMSPIAQVGVATAVIAGGSVLLAKQPTLLAKSPVIKALLVPALAAGGGALAFYKGKAKYKPAAIAAMGFGFGNLMIGGISYAMARFGGASANPPGGQRYQVRQPQRLAAPRQARAVKMAQTASTSAFG